MINSRVHIRLTTIAAMFVSILSSALAQEWKVESGKAQTAYDASNGVLKITVAKEHQGNLVLRPTSPLKLQPDDLRIYADVAAEKSFTLKWLVTADNGQEYEFPSAQIPGGVWTQTVSEYIGGERRLIPSLVPQYPHPRFKALPARISGIALTASAESELLITGIKGDSTEYLLERRWEYFQKTSPNRFPGMTPFGAGDVGIPLDKLLPLKEGHYDLDWNLADRYQGAPIAGGTMSVEWNPDDRLNVRNQILKIAPPPGTHTFWLTVKVRDMQGYLVERIRYAIGTFRDGKYQPAGADDRLANNPGGHLVICPIAENCVFGDPGSVGFRLLRKTEQPVAAKIRINATDVSFMARGQKGLYGEYDWKPDNEGSMTLALSGTQAGAAYKVSFELLDHKNRKIDQDELTIGVLAPAVKEDSLRIVQPTLQDMFPRHRINLNNCDIADFYGTVYIPATKSFADFYREAARSWKKCQVTTVRLAMPTTEIQPLPNFFDCRSVDLRTKILREEGLTYNFGLSRDVSPAKPEWMPLEVEENYMGLDWVRTPPESNLSPAASVPLQKAAFDHFYPKYKNDPDFMGWVIWSDWFVRDSYRSCYSSFFQPMFLRFLEEVKGVRTDEELNLRYGVKDLHLTPWLIPVPEVDRKNDYGAEKERFAPLPYRDLLEFKAWILKETQMGFLRHVRQAGETRAIGFYAIPLINVEYYLDDLLKQGCFATIGREGSVYHDSLRNQAYPTFYRDFRFLNEYTAFTPGCEFGHYWTDMKERDCDRLLASLMMTGGNNINFTMLYGGPDFPGIKCETTEKFWLYPQEKKEKFFAEIRQRQEAGLQRQTRWLEALNQGYIRSKIVPWQMAVLSHGVCGGNSGGTGIGQFLTPDYPFHLLKDFSDDRGFREQKLIWVPESPGLFHFDADFSEKMLSRLVDYVKNGGKVVIMSPDAGRYTYLNPEKQFALLQALGWKDAVNLTPDGSLEKRAKTSANGIFSRTKDLHFKGPRPAARLAEMPEGSTIEAFFDDGQPACVRWKCGRGEVVLFMARLDLPLQPKADFVDDLTAWSGFEWPVKLSKPAFNSLTHDGNVFYLMLYREDKSGKPENSIVAIKNLPAGKYTAEEIGPTPYAALTVSDEEFRRGIELEIPIGMRLLRLTPEKHP